MLLLETVVRRRSRPAQYNNPVAQPAVLREGAVPLALDELVRVYVLARGLAAGHEEDMVGHEGDRVQEGNESVDDHCEGDAPLVYSLAEGNVVTLRVVQQLPERRESEVEAQ